MQSNYGSPSPSQQSEEPFPPNALPSSKEFVISREDANMLQEYVDAFQEGDADVRNTIIAAAMAELYSLHPPTVHFNKVEVSKKVRKWFYNHYSQPERQYVKFTRKWSARNTFYHMCRDEVMMEAEEMSGALPGSQAFLGSLQDATTKLWTRLPSEEQDVFASLAKKWSEEAPPPHIQARMASSISGKIIRDFQTQLYKTCGVRSVVLTAHKHEDGQTITGIHEVNKLLDADTYFLKFCPDWKDAPLFREWQKFAKKCFKGDVQTAQKDRSKTIKTPIPIHTKSNGCPDIPDITIADGYKTKVVQTMLRDYCTAHIRYASGKKKVTIPWSKLCQDPSSWIKSECVPDGFQWADPSKIRIGDVFRLLEHWRLRQANHLKPLIWVSSCPLLEGCHSHLTDDEGSEDLSDSRDGADFRSDDGIGTHSEDTSKSRPDDGVDTTSEDAPDPRSDSMSDGGASDNAGHGESDYHMHSPPPDNDPLELFEGSQTNTPLFGNPENTQYSPAPGPSSHRTHMQRMGHHSAYESAADDSDPIQRSEDDSSDPSDDMSDQHKRIIKMIERAKHMDTGRGVGKINTHYLEWER